MARQGFYAIKDQEKIALLQSKNTQLSTEEATEALRLEWIEQIAACYKEGIQPAFGPGFTGTDDVWLNNVIQAIKNKTSPRPPYPEPKIESALFMSGY